MSVRKGLTFVTGNPNKLKEVTRILGETKGFLERYEVGNKGVDLPEYQGEPEYVSEEKCKLAAQQVEGSVFCEDTSLCFNALGGLPGVYIKWFKENVGLEGINKMLDGFDDRSAYAQCVFAYCENGGEGEPKVRIFAGRCPGKIVRPRGDGFGWDPIFQPDGGVNEGKPDGEKLTFAQMTKEQKDEISHRRRALEKLSKHLMEGDGKAAAAAAAGGQ